MGAAMMDPMYSLRENGAQHGGRGVHLRLSTLLGSRKSDLCNQGILATMPAATTWL